MQVAELPRWIVKDDAEVRDFFSVVFSLVLVSFVKVQLFRQRLSHMRVKAYATMPVDIMGSKSLNLLD